LCDREEWGCHEVLGITGLPALSAYTMRIVSPSQPSADGASALPKMVTPSLAALWAYTMRGMFATHASARRAGTMRMMGTAGFIRCVHRPSGPPFPMYGRHRCEGLAASVTFSAVYRVGAGADNRHSSPRAQLCPLLVGITNWSVGRGNHMSRDSCGP
jgi:hypothetical protein